MAPLKNAFITGKPASLLIVILFAQLFFYTPIFAQKKPAGKTAALLQSGPMVGYSEMKEVALWVQTKSEAEVYFTYYDASAPNKFVEETTEKVRTTAENAFTAKLIANKVEPGKKYTYQLYINGNAVKLPYEPTFQTQALWQWRTDAPDFTFAMGSCAYVNDSVYDRPGKPYGGSYKIFESIYNKKPDMMLWSGDNVYLREADWYSRTGIFYRYTHTRSLPQIQPLLANCHNYALWDDHDYGPNDSDRGFRSKHFTKQAFDLFWANPENGAKPASEGIYTTFEWNDVQFFMLDDRWFRSPDNSKTDRTMLGREQIKWLMDNLVTSRATFKVIAMGGQVLNPAQVKENYSTYRQELDSLLGLIKKEDIRGVIFLSGDRHHTELTKMDRAGTYPLYDFTISPLTSGVHFGAEKEGNTFRVPGTLVEQQNFAVAQVSGAKKDRAITFVVYDIDGKELWRRTLTAAELK